MVSTAQMGINANSASLTAYKQEDEHRCVEFRIALEQNLPIRIQLPNHCVFEFVLYPLGFQYRKQRLVQCFHLILSNCASERLDGQRCQCWALILQYAKIMPCHFGERASANSGIGVIESLYWPPSCSKQIRSCTSRQIVCHIV